MKKFIKQQNGRERGQPGNGMGAHQDTSPLARGTTTKTKRAKRRQEDRRQKSRGWEI